ncbi:MAG: M23 family metallopeptidase [Desulfuromonadales bacterium]
MRIVVFVLGFFWPVLASGASLDLSSTSIGTGEVAVLEYQGDTPAVALGRFRENVFFLTPNDMGASALVGVDVQAETGEYPLRVAVVDREGRSQFHEMMVRVEEVERPAERLTLPREMVTPADPALLRRIARERDLLRELFGRNEGEFTPGPLHLPVDDPVGSPFGLRRILNGIPKSPHSGVDFRSPAGTEIRAPLDGSVVFAGDLYYTGRTVVLDHGAGLFTYYAHLRTTEAHPGDRIRQGEAVGTVGSTGRSTGPHLHWGAKLRGDRIDPLVLRRELARERP